MQTAAHTNHSCIQLHKPQGQHKAGNDKHTDRTERWRKCLPAMQVSLQPTYRLSNMKMKPKHCVSNWSYCNQTSQHQIHYTNSEQIQTVLNYRIITICYVKWEKFFLVSDGGSTSRSVITVHCYQKHLSVLVIMKQNTWNVKMRRIWWLSVCVGRFRQTPPK